MGRLAILNIEHWLIVPLRDDCGKFAILLLPRTFALKRERESNKKRERDSDNEGEVEWGNRVPARGQLTVATALGHVIWQRMMSAHSISQCHLVLHLSGHCGQTHTHTDTYTRKQCST